MKNPLLSLILAVAVLSSPALFAQDATSTSSSSNTPVGNGDTSSDGGDQRGERLREVFAQLDLSDAQKAQIKQIRASTSPGRERRQQIMAVLTPAQKEKLVGMIRAYRADQGGQ